MTLNHSSSYVGNIGVLHFGNISVLHFGNIEPSDTNGTNVFFVFGHIPLYLNVTQSLCLQVLHILPMGRRHQKYILKYGELKNTF